MRGGSGSYCKDPAELLVQQDCAFARLRQELNSVREVHLAQLRLAQQQTALASSELLLSKKDIARLLQSNDHDGSHESPPIGGRAAAPQLRELLDERTAARRVAQALAYHVCRQSAEISALRAVDRIVPSLLEGGRESSELIGTKKSLEELQKAYNTLEEAYVKLKLESTEREVEIVRLHGRVGRLEEELQEATAHITRLASLLKDAQDASLNSDAPTSAAAVKNSKMTQGQNPRTTGPSDHRIQGALDALGSDAKTPMLPNLVKAATLFGKAASFLPSSSWLASAPTGQDSNTPPQFADLSSITSGFAPARPLPAAHSFISESGASPTAEGGKPREEPHDASASDSSSPWEDCPNEPAVLGQSAPSGGRSESAQESRVRLAAVPTPSPLPPSSFSSLPSPSSPPPVPRPLLLSAKAEDPIPPQEIDLEVLLKDED